MKILIKEVFEIAIGTGRTHKISIDTIKFILMTSFNKKSLLYSHVAKSYLKSFCDIATRLGYGRYDIKDQVFVLNVENDVVTIMFAKHNIPIPKVPKIKKPSIKQQREMLDDRHGKTKQVQKRV